MQDATAHPTTRQVSVTEAARELGISTETVRRRIKSGELQAERAIRPQGTVWLVSLHLTTPHGVPPLAPVTAPSEASLSKPEHATQPEAWHPSPPLDATPASTAALVASIARLIAELAEVRVISDRRADQLVSQAETIGELRAEVAALKAAETAQATHCVAATPSVTVMPPGLKRRGWRTWLGLGLLVMVVGTASCQTAASVKNPGLCTSARATMDLWSNALAGRPATDEHFAPIQAAIAVAEKTC